MITTNDLNISYSLSSGKKLVAIENLNWTVEDGTFNAIIGPSGCGKSSLLRTIAGLQPASSGELQVNLSNPNQIQNISMTFQSATLLPWLTVEKNILLPFRISSVNVDSFIMDKLNTLLETVGLSKFHHAYPHELSGGMCMRVALIRAFITESRLILMDEPFAALDELTRDKLCFELERLWLASKSTILFVTHNLSEAILLSDKVTILSNHPGRLVKEIDINISRPRSYETRLNSDFISQLSELRKELLTGE